MSFFVILLSVSSSLRWRNWILFPSCFQKHSVVERTLGYRGSLGTVTTFEPRIIVLNHILKRHRDLAITCRNKVSEGV